MAREVVDLTVAVATLDRPDDLEGCLEALLAGEVLPAEVVVVDQSPDDRTETRLAMRQGDVVPIVYVRQERLGLSASRNAAIDRAARPVVAFTDDDCVPDRHWVAAVARAFQAADGPDAVAGRVVPSGPAAPGSYVVSPRADVTRTTFRGRSIPWHVGTGGNLAVRRAWLDRIGAYDGQLGAGSPGHAAEDADLIYRLLRAGAAIRYEPDAIVYHRRQSRAQRLRSRRGYGHGIGAFCALWLRRGDVYAGFVLAHWLYRLLRESVAAAVRLDWFEVHQRLLGMGGTASGLRYGFRADAAARPLSPRPASAPGHLG